MFIYFTHVILSYTHLVPYSLIILYIHIYRSVANMLFMWAYYDTLVGNPTAGVVAVVCISLFLFIGK